VTVNRPPTALTVARVQAIEIAVNWRWAPVMFLGTWLLAQHVIPARFPTWEISTAWVTSAAAVIAGEAALLLHEVSHAVFACRKGQRVRRIVFHGFHAHTVVDTALPAPRDEVLIALVGPGLNLALAGIAEAMRRGLATQGPMDVALLMFVIGNAATTALSLLPLGASDGARALTALRSSGCRSGPESG
jgi:Zn-dependent protease